LSTTLGLKPLTVIKKERRGSRAGHDSPFTKIIQAVPQQFA